MVGSEVCTWTNPSSDVGLVVVGEVVVGASGEDIFNFLSTDKVCGTKNNEGGGLNCNKKTAEKKRNKLMEMHRVVRGSWWWCSPYVGRLLVVLVCEKF